MLVKKLNNIAIKAGEIILEYYQSDNIGVEVKDDDSPVTLADKAANDYIIDELTKLTDHPIVTEEDAANHLKDFQPKTFWLIDPLDGTKSFINKEPSFTVNIALIEDNVPKIGVIYVPASGELFYTNEQGTKAFKGNDEIKVRERSNNLTIIASKSHLSTETEEYIKSLPEVDDFISVGSSLKFCKLAEGVADIYPRFSPTMEWDTAAGHVVATEAGAKIVTSPEGNDLQYNKENLLNPHFLVSV